MSKNDSITLSRGLVEDAGLSIEARMIYAVLVSKSDGREEFSVSVKEMIDCLGITRQRFNKHREQLEDAGLIEVENRRGSIHGIETIYRLKK